MTDESKLLELNAQGIIPGPDETEGEFFARADYCLHLKNHLSPELPFTADELADHSAILPSLAAVRKQYDCAPDWMPVFFSNFRLMPWHGGCAWIFQLNSETPTSALFQLRKSFRNQSHYLGILSRDEVLRHELCHVGRMMFDEPRYEELLAYRTSRSPFRRWSGALALSSNETGMFFLLLLLLCALDIFLLAYGSSSSYLSAQWLKLLPLGLLGYAFFRLSVRRSRFNETLRKLKGLTDDAEPFIFRLTDKEIDLFAGLSNKEIRDYANAQGSLRWQLLRCAYPMHK